MGVLLVLCSVCLFVVVIWFTCGVCVVCGLYQVMWLQECEFFGAVGVGWDAIEHESCEDAE